jgi:lysophospholipase L1-like esterase
MKRWNLASHLVAVVLLALLAPSGSNGKEHLQGTSQLDLSTFRAAALEKWSEAIAALESKDKTEVHPDDSILFVGSSSIRLWEDIAADMAPYHPIQRGYGGARWTDVAIFAERLIKPHKYRAIVFFVANDITGGDKDRTPREVVDLFAAVHATARRHNPGAPIFYIAVTPTESRWQTWPKIRAGNSLVREFCEQSDNTHFIGTESIYLDGTSKPRPELFLSDRLHLNRDGYIRWAAAIKSQLDTVLSGVKTGSITP